MIARVRNGVPLVGITGLGTYVPDRIVTNEDIAKMIDTSDEWIVERTGIRQRRVAEPDQATSDVAVPAAREALERAETLPEDVDLLICATASPDMLFPASASLVAEELGAVRAAAYDLSAGCTGFVYALAQAYGVLAGELASCALVVGSETLSKLTDWTDRGTCVLFGDGAGAAVLQQVGEGGFLGFELGSDGSGGADICIPGGGSRAPATAETVEQRLHFLRMNGREVYRFATRIMVTSAEQLLEACGLGVEDVDLYVPHQANERIISHAAKQLGLPAEKVFINVDRYGNTSTASIPIGLYEALADGTLTEGARVLMTAVGAGLSWGSTLMIWANSS